MNSESAVGSTIVPTVTVGASATVEAVPDEAHLNVNLSADGRSSNGALEAVRKRLDAINEICDRLDVAEADRSSSVSVTEQGERDGGRWLSKGYRATARLRLLVRSAEAVGRVVSAMVEEAGPEVTGPYWRVSPDHPARIEACAKAGRQARAKAEAYADALGASLGPIVSATEPGVSASPVYEGEVMAAAAPVPMAARMSRAGGPEPAPVIDLHAGTQEVRAHVNVVFRIDQ